MKYVLSWQTRSNVTEEVDARSLQVFRKWSPNEGTTFLQFVARIDGAGGSRRPMALRTFCCPPRRPGRCRPPNALSPLLGWGDADLVYVTYGKIWFPVFVAFTLCAFVMYQQRRPGLWETWVWRVTLTGYVLACGVSLAVDQFGR
jgi:hypothetical protein